MTATVQFPAHSSGNDAPAGTLIITRREVLQLLTLDACIDCVEHAFKMHGNGTASAPAVLGLHAEAGGFHIKAATLELDQPYFAAKTNSNFPLNPARHGLPTIQGMIALFDARSGYPLALMDSIEITRMRTGAASAIAAKHLAKKETAAVTVIGCGTQASTQLDAILRVRQPKCIHLFDADPDQARRLARHITRNRAIDVAVVPDPEPVVMKSEICITCPPSKRHVVKHEWVQPGTFIAAVGADSEDKCEIDPRLMAGSKVVADIRDQCAAIGDLHHAIRAGLMASSDIYAELGEIVTGRKAGRTGNGEIFVFDSTGTALQDVAAAATVYRNALLLGGGTSVNLNDYGDDPGKVAH